MTITSPTVPAAEAPPSLSIQVESAGVVPHAAVPTLGFQLRLDNPGAQPVRALALHARLQIAATGRRYDPRSQRRLVELFGLPPEWGRTLRSLPWTRATVMVPAFSRRVRAELPVTCTYDFEVTATKYLHALGGGEVPLEFLFSGTVFYAAEGRLQAAQLPWSTEARFGLPVALWRELMDLYYPERAWLRLHRDTVDKLYSYRARHTFASWEETLEALLRTAEPDRSE